MKYPIIHTEGRGKWINGAVVLSTILLSGLINFTGREVHALCLSDDVTLSVEEDVAPEDESFVSSSPASSETEFKLEVDLTNADFSNLDLFPEQTEETSDDDTTESNGTSDMNGEIASSDDLTDSGDEAIEAESAPAPWTISREDWLDGAAEDVNECP